MWWLSYSQFFPFPRNVLHKILTTSCTTHRDRVSDTPSHSSPDASSRSEPDASSCSEPADRGRRPIQTHVPSSPLVRSRAYTTSPSGDGVIIQDEPGTTQNDAPFSDPSFNIRHTNDHFSTPSPLPTHAVIFAPGSLMGQRPRGVYGQSFQRSGARRSGESSRSQALTGRGSQSFPDR